MKLLTYYLFPLIIILFFLGCRESYDVARNVKIPAADLQFVDSGESRPNVILILADDLGYGDLGIYGHPDAKTPNLDKLAKDGIRFTKFYSNGRSCAPSKVALMTGLPAASFAKNPWQYGLGSTLTLPRKLNEAGYINGHFGKWHLSPRSEISRFGFHSLSKKIKKKDRSARRTKNSKIEEKTKNGIVELTPRKNQRDVEFFAQAENFIRKNKDKPFYMNIWGKISHSPIVPTEPKFIEQYDELEININDYSSDYATRFNNSITQGIDSEQTLKYYLAEISLLDSLVGNIVKTLREEGLEENTIVVFSSDQGPSSERKNHSYSPGYTMGLKGGKHTFFEGGLRVPFIVKWPKYISPGIVDSTSVISGLDWTPTVLSLAGFEFRNEYFPGIDLSEVFLQQSNTIERTLFWSDKNLKRIALLKDNWKYIQYSDRLYDLSRDPYETDNLIESNISLRISMDSLITGWKHQMLVNRIVIDRPGGS